MDARRYTSFVLGMVLLLTWMDTGSVARALDTREDRATLRGIKGFYVVVEDLAPEIEKIGLTRNQIKEDTEGIIRRAGIRVLSKDEWRNEKGGPWLYVNINIMKVETGTYAYAYDYSVEIQFRQRVILVRNPHLEVFATTWSREFLYKSGYLGDVRNSVREALRHFTDTFTRQNQPPRNRPPS